MNPTVYRHYDKFGNLLYVGCTTDPETRLSGHKVTTKTINIREELNRLFEKGSGNHGNSRWDALNAVTDYVDHQDFRDNHSQMVNDINKRLVESIAYKDAPPTIQRQMEMQAGFKPAPDHERDLEPATNGNEK